MVNGSVNGYIGRGWMDGYLKEWINSFFTNNFVLIFKILHFSPKNVKKQDT